MKPNNEMVGDLIDAAREVASDVAREAKNFLASDTGKKVRHYAATGLIMAAPAVASLPGLRKTRLGKLVEMAGGAAIVVTVAEKLRDWEPGSNQG